MMRRRLRWAPPDPVTDRLVFVGCSRRKRAATRPLQALELYEGGCIPQLRARLGRHPAYSTRLRILSAEHGLLDADTPVLPYDRPLDPDRAAQLQPVVGADLLAEAARDGMPRHLLVVAEPLYLHLLTDLLNVRRLRPELIHIPTHHRWPEAAAVLDEWGWP
ncbi:DUF6884 domain-containing protein [Actinoplanes sp. NPDC051859]|uniref:DUF6884 domain-containing protein n=1 Tax=Actinoplanes sp. NPDC051859 TaxID=3363909 RepID=UPI00378B83C8